MHSHTEWLTVNMVDLPVGKIEEKNGLNDVVNNEQKQTILLGKDSNIL